MALHLLAFMFQGVATLANAYDDEDFIRDEVDRHVCVARRLPKANRRPPPRTGIAAGKSYPREDAPMFIVLLKFADNKADAPRHMDGHKAWLEQGFADGVFILSGSVQPKQGGAVFAANTTRDELEHRIAQDPFVAEDVVHAEIIEIDASRADDRLSFLCD